MPSGSVDVGMGVDAIFWLYIVNIAFVIMKWELTKEEVKYAV